MNAFDRMMQAMSQNEPVITEAEMARKLGVTDQRFHNWKGRGSIPKNMLEPIADILGINLKWLISGRGDKRPPQSYVDAKEKLEKQGYVKGQDTIDLLQPMLGSLSESLETTVREILKKIPTMPEKEQREALDMVNAAIARTKHAAGPAISAMTGTNPFGQGNTTENPSKTLINIYENIEASAGDGSVVNSEEPTDHLWVENKWLQEIVHYVPSDMAIIKVKGDSMEPTLSPGDMILIDRQPIERDQLNDGIYVINRNGTTHVKRLQSTEEGIRIISDNKTLYEAETVTDNLIVCGRVIWAWRGKRF